MRTYRDTSYSTGDLVYYKRDKFKTWKGPATVIGQDGQEVLIKHVSSTIRVHPCRLQKVREQNPSVDESKLVRDEGYNNDPELDNHSKVTESHVNEKQNHFEGVDDSDTVKMIVSTT